MFNINIITTGAKVIYLGQGGNQTAGGTGGAFTGGVPCCTGTGCSYGTIGTSGAGGNSIMTSTSCGFSAIGGGGGGKYLFDCVYVCLIPLDFDYRCIET